MYKKYNYIKHLNFLNNTFQIYSTVFKKKPPTNLLLQCFHDKRQAYVSLISIHDHCQSSSPF